MGTAKCVVALMSISGSIQVFIGDAPSTYPTLVLILNYSRSLVGHISKDRVPSIMSYIEKCKLAYKATN